MDRVEERLKSLAMAAPSDVLRAHLLKAAGRERPSEWKRLQHTMRLRGDSPGPAHDNLRGATGPRGAAGGGDARGRGG